MVSFHDPHRCGDVSPQYGSFCERFGSGEIGMGSIGIKTPFKFNDLNHNLILNFSADWHPIYYQWDEIDLPYNVPDTEPTRRDIAAQYTTISRLDQGLFIKLQF